MYLPSTQRFLPKGKVQTLRPSEATLRTTSPLTGLGLDSDPVRGWFLRIGVALC